MTSVVSRRAVHVRPESLKVVRAGLDWYQGGEYVITDEVGTPVHPSGIPMSSGAYFGGPGCGGSPCTTRVIRR
jgi:hypothetical protein